MGFTNIFEADLDIFMFIVLLQLPTSETTVGERSQKKIERFCPKLLDS